MAKQGIQQRKDILASMALALLRSVGNNMEQAHKRDMETRKLTAFQRRHLDAIHSLEVMRAHGEICRAFHKATSEIGNLDGKAEAQTKKAEKNKKAKKNAKKG